MYMKITSTTATTKTKTKATKIVEISNFPAQVACGTGILLSELGMTTGDSYWMSANATQTGWKVTINGYVCPNKRAYVSNKGLLLIVFYQLALKIICLKEQYAVMIIT